jgi:hypothetical protein
MPAKGHYEMEGSYDGATREKKQQCPASYTASKVLRVR